MSRTKAIVAALVALALMIGSLFLFKVPLPHIQLPAEWIPGTPVITMPFGGSFYITNTVIAIVVTDILLIVLAIFAGRKMEMVPSGAQNLFEMVIEFWENTAVQMIGEDLTRRWLPLVLTIFLMVVVSNWSELIPGYDTVGILCEESACTPTEESHASIPPLVSVAMAQDHGEAEAGQAGGEAGAEAAPHEEGAEAHGEHTLFYVDGSLGPFGLATRRAEETDDPEQLRGFVPFLRVAASDLNFTLALALVSFVAIQIVGLRALGMGYVKKFLAFGWIPDLIRGKEGHSRLGILANGFLAVFVGLLELISELSRIISFSFRLFGNMFAGQILLFVIPFLIPFLAVVPIYGLELFVGMIQGFVFAILTLAFMATAVISHDDQH